MGLCIKTVFWFKKKSFCEITYRDPSYKSGQMTHSTILAAEECDHFKYGHGAIKSDEKR